MEKERGYLMVNNIKWTAIDCREIESHNYRLDASAYNVDARNAEYIVSISPWKKLPLIGNGGFVEHAHYGGRLKRKYIDKYNIDAIGFLGSSEMLQVNPLPEKFLSRNFPHISDLKVTKNTVLLSRSGTIGNLALVNKTLESFLISEHAIRLERASFPGYIYAFLKSDTGQLLIKSKVYGAVVDQIEPEQIAEIMVPDPSADIKKIINNKIIESYDLRDRSNDLI